MNSKEQKLAVLIDADNVPYANIKGMLEEIAKYGILTIKRIYGDWTKPTVAGWKSILLDMQLLRFNNTVIPLVKMLQILP